MLLMHVLAAVALSLTIDNSSLDGVEDSGWGWSSLQKMFAFARYLVENISYRFRRFRRILRAKRGAVSCMAEFALIFRRQYNVRK